MQLIPIKTSLIKSGDDVISLLLSKLKKQTLNTGDLIAVASKIVALDQNRLVNLNKVKISPKAKKMAKTYQLEPAFIQLVLDEADTIKGGVSQAILTLKNNIVIANAGIDHSNLPPDFVSLWPAQPWRWAEKFKNEIYKNFKKKVGVIIIDSHVLPLRQGTQGLALAIAGFQGVIDERGKKDLYGKKMQITKKNMADDLASATHCLMGEVDEKIPLVIIKKPPIKMTGVSARTLTEKLKMSPKRCLYKNY